MDRFLSFSRPSRRPLYHWNYIATCVNGLFSLAVLFGLATLWSRDWDSALDKASNATPRQLSSYQVIGFDGTNKPKVLLVPVKFDERGHPTVVVDFPFIQSGDSSSSGHVGTVTPPAEGVPESSSILDKNDNEFYPLYLPRITNKKEDMVAMIRNGVPWRLSSIPSDLDTALPHRNRTRSITFLVGASSLLVLGAVLLKKALEKAHRWERQLQVDSLAYDLAYTDTRSYPGYGSFVSLASLDEFDRFDV